MEIELLFSKHPSLSLACLVSGTFLSCPMTGTPEQPAKKHLNCCSQLKVERDDVECVRIKEMKEHRKGKDHFLLERWSDRLSLSDGP